MSLNQNQLETEILQFVQSRAPNNPGLTRDSDLLDTGILDSLLLMDLIFQVEERYGVRLGSEHIGPDNFRTPAAIAGLVLGQSGRSSAA